MWRSLWDRVLNTLWWTNSSARALKWNIMRMMMLLLMMMMTLLFWFYIWNDVALLLIMLVVKRDGADVSACYRTAMGIMMDNIMWWILSISVTLSMSSAEYSKSYNEEVHWALLSAEIAFFYLMSRSEPLEVFCCRNVSQWCPCCVEGFTMSSSKACHRTTCRRTIEQGDDDDAAINHVYFCTLSYFEHIRIMVTRSLTSSASACLLLSW